MLLLPFVPTCLLCVDECCSFFDQPFAGGSPAATHFLCLAKESKQRKATAGSRSFGLPGAAKQKNGRGNKLASLRQISPLFPFFASHHRLAPSGTAKLARCASPGVARLRRRNC